MATHVDTAFRVLGSLIIIYLASLVLKFLHFSYIYLRPSSISRYHYHEPSTDAPPWAIITGSTDGIGKGFADELAHHGFNVVLHGRSRTKLQNVLYELQTAYPHTSFRTIFADASSSGAVAREMLDGIVEEIKDLHVTVLINNVGSGSKNSGELISPFVLDSPADIDVLIDVNVRFPVHFTRAVLPLMLQHGGPVLVLTMGSMSDFGMPYMSIYSAAKSFDLCFSRALRREMQAEGKDVEVLGIMTAAVTGVSWDRSGASFFRPTARQFARAAIGRVGCGREVVAAWWTHGVVWTFMIALPGCALDWALVSGVRRARAEMAKSG